MSDDLVKRLRDKVEASRIYDDDEELLDEAADRIEKLDRENNDMAIHFDGLVARIEKLEAALSLAENWMSNRAVHFGEFCTSKQCVCGKALVLFNVLQALEGKDG